jgi:hypothetical protein
VHLQTRQTPAVVFFATSFYESSARFSAKFVVRGHNTGLSMQTPNNRSRLRTKQEIIARLIRSKSFHFTYGCHESFDGFYPARIPCEVFLEEVVRGRIAHNTSPTDGGQRFERSPLKRRCQVLKKLASVSQRLLDASTHFWIRI